MENNDKTENFTPCTWTSSSLSQYKWASRIPGWERSKLKYSWASSALPWKIFWARATEWGESPSSVQIVLKALSFHGVAAIVSEWGQGASNNEVETIWLTELASDLRAWALDTWAHFRGGAGIVRGGVGEQEHFFPYVDGQGSDLHEIVVIGKYLVCFRWWVIFLVTLLIIILASLMTWV